MAEHQFTGNQQQHNQQPPLSFLLSPESTYSNNQGLMVGQSNVFGARLNNGSGLLPSITGTPLPYSSPSSTREQRIFNGSMFGHTGYPSGVIQQSIVSSGTPLNISPSGLLSSIDINDMIQNSTSGNSSINNTTSPSTMVQSTLQLGYPSLIMGKPSSHPTSFCATHPPQTYHDTRGYITSAHDIPHFENTLTLVPLQQHAPSPVVQQMGNLFSHQANGSTNQKTEAQHGMFFSQSNSGNMFNMHSPMKQATMKNTQFHPHTGVMIPMCSATTPKTVVEPISSLFKGFEICLSGKFNLIQRKFEHLIQQHGGSIQKSINAVVTHLISTDFELQQEEKAVKVAKALGKGIPIIREEFIHDSIASNSLQSIQKYLLNDPSKRGSAAIFNTFDTNQIQLNEDHASIDLALENGKKRKRREPGSRATKKKKDTLESSDDSNNEQSKCGE